MYKFNSKVLTALVKELKETEVDTVFADQIEAISDIMAVVESGLPEGKAIRSAIHELGEGLIDRAKNKYANDTESTEILILAIFDLLSELLMIRAKFEKEDQRRFARAREKVRETNQTEAVDLANKILEAHGTALKLYSK